MQAEISEKFILDQTFNKVQAEPVKKSRKFVIFSFAFWTLPVIYRFIQSYLAHIILDVPARLSFTISLILIDWYYWAVITPIVFWLGRQFPLEDTKNIRNLMVHLPIAILAAGIHIFLISAVINSGTPEVAFREVFVRTASSFGNSFLIYSGILAVCFSFSYSRRFKEREVQTANLKNELSQAQLHALQMQLQPHFLFNTLNSISALTHKNPKDANTMIARLSELLRVLLSKEPLQEITLEEELNFLQTYLGIEQVRFQDRLTLDFNIEPETLNSYIPSLILQPLVENAIRHGISKRRGKGVIKINSKRVKENLMLQVLDNGLGLPVNSRGGFTFDDGIGLKNTRNRLQKLYGNQHFFGIWTGEKDKGGVEITIIIPFRTSLYEQDKNTNN